MAPYRLAVLSDVHGDVTALRAVLDDAAARDVDAIVNLGDVVGKGPRGSEAVRLTRERCLVTVRGNWEAYVAGPGEPYTEAVAWWRAELTDADRAWLTSRPAAIDLLLSGRRTRLLHASATDEFTRLRFHHDHEQFLAMFANTPFTADAVVLGVHGVREAGARAGAEVGARAEAGAGLPGAWASRGVTPTLVVYGDIHDAYLETVDSLTLLNVGSAGNPLDEPHAAYAILEGELDGASDAPFSIQHVRVPFDVEAEIAVARERGMPELEPYASELRTAVHRGRHVRGAAEGSAG